MINCVICGNFDQEVSDEMGSFADMEEAIMGKCEDGVIC